MFLYACVCCVIGAIQCKRVALRKKASIAPARVPPCANVCLLVSNRKCRHILMYSRGKVYTCRLRFPTFRKTELTKCLAKKCLVIASSNCVIGAEIQFSPSSHVAHSLVDTLARNYACMYRIYNIYIYIFFFMYIYTL